MRTFHLLKTPDILCANDSRLSVSYYLSNNTVGIDLVSNFFGTGMSASVRRSVQARSCVDANQGNALIELFGWIPSSASGRITGFSESRHTVK
jgi:hypothetical protein